ncbi:hypothetical protein CAEBREN_19676 [Caenorhabditis brenneri]|uniref:Uncharacterized protein n=1 Tax=Caenorhabditis brenneri TaxID=135651 RepID=G0M741_CAEBE|nr:hypothetical protein CAEBREN_19676 [Caenorhabditis brenneri]
MGQVDKEPIRLVIILASGCIFENYETSRRLRNIVDCVASKFAELFLSTRDDFEFRGFEIISRDCKYEDFHDTHAQMQRDKPDIYLNVFLGSFTRLTSSNKQFMNCFFIPFSFVRKLPDSMDNERKWSPEERVNAKCAMAHFFHEICHSLGGFHSDEGLMKTEFDLLADETITIRDMKLSDIIDKKTRTIICESMSIITTFVPQRSLDVVDGELTYISDQSIAAAYFLKGTKYTESFDEFNFLDALKIYTAKVPEEYDAFVVVHFCGHIYYFSRTDIQTTKRCTRVTTF